MKVKSEYFKQISRGTRTVEARLFDEKRQSLKIGDLIEFTDANAPGKKIMVTIVALHHFPSFSKLFDHFIPNSFGGETKDEFLFSMEKIYSQEDEKKYGALAMEIRTIVV